MRARRAGALPAGAAPRPVAEGGLVWRWALLAALLAGALVLPSDAARDIPAVYGARHPGLEHSALYPPLD
jgi:hypothetical protein